jgi:hypothetical protein
MKITLKSIETKDGRELTIKQAREYLASKKIMLSESLALSLINDKIKNCVGSTAGKQIINK